MRELDSVLVGFLDSEYPSLSDRQKWAFANVLELPDPDIYGYLAGRSVPADTDIADVISAIRQSVRPPS